jgi:hypothetical protein
MMYFEEHKGLPPFLAIQHSIYLIPSYSLPNYPTYRTTPMESAKIKGQIKQPLEEGKNRPNTFPSGSLTLIVPQREQQE